MPGADLTLEVQYTQLGKKRFIFKSLFIFDLIYKI